MALETRVVDVKFTKGQDTKTQAKLVVPGEWTSLVNMSLSDEYTPKTRDGHGALLSTANGNGLATRDDELCIIGAPSLYSYSPGSSTVASVSGKLGSVELKKAEVYADTRWNCGQDVAYGGGYLAYTWLDGLTNLSYAMIVDATSGAHVLPPTEIGSAAATRSPRVSYADSAFFFTFIVTGTTTMRCRVVLTSAPSTLGADTAILTNVQASNFDTCTFCTGTTVLAAVARTAGAGATSGDAILIQRAGTVPSVAATSNFALNATQPRANMNGMAVAATSTYAGVFFINSGGGTPGTWCITFDTSLATLSGGTNLIDATTPPVNGESHITACTFGVQMIVFTDQQSSFGTANFRPIRRTEVSSAGAILNGPTTIGNSATFRINVAEASGPQGPFIAGKAFSATVGSSTRTYLPVMVLENYNTAGLGTNTAITNAQCSWFLLDATISSVAAASMVAHALYGALGLVDPTGGGAAPTVFTPPSTPSIATGQYLTPQLERRALQTAQGINITPVGICALTLTVNDSTGPERVQLGSDLFLGGGSLTSYDGTNLVEHGFPLYPEGISAVVTAAAAGSVTVGKHSICATYEWTDAAGLRHQSAPSPAVEFTFANATDQLDVIVPTLLVSQKSNVLISLWMTEASGTTFYRVVNSFATPMANTTAASTVSFTGANAIGRGVTCPDSSLRKAEILYSEPTKATDTLPNIIPPPARIFTQHQNRMVVLADDDPGAYWISQPLVPNTGLMFNPAIRGRLPAEGGEPFAVASLDEKLVFFCERRIFVVYGQGPRPDGSFSSYTEPQDIQSDVGCSDARSVLGELPGGIVFKSSKGWYMLGRDLSTQYIGDGVASYDSASVRAATLCGDMQEARFVTNSSDGAVLVYSYLRQVWSVYKFGTNYVANDAVWWPTDNSGAGGYVTVSTTSGLNHDVTNTNVFDSIAGVSTPFVVSGSTGWLRLDALEAYQRVRRLYLTATCLTSGTINSTLALSFSFDDKPATAYSSSADIGVLDSNSTGIVDLSHKLKIQKCKSFRLSFTDTPAAVDVVRLSGIQAMALEVGLKRGVNKLKAAQNVG